MAEALVIAPVMQYRAMPIQLGVVAGSAAAGVSAEAVVVLAAGGAIVIGQVRVGCLMLMEILTMPTPFFHHILTRAT